ncbi:MAG: hypothetical protein L3I99_08110 [Sulfurimonas sp.]|nr:hypothetical protein [Sulfurimonas sp.]
MAKYLYGASVQGIQEFIFATNKLQEIVGASEIVKSIEKIFKDNFSPDEILLNAAGNIKAIFHDEKSCKKAVLEFAKLVQQNAFGITISQAVVSIGDKHTQDDLNKLEKNLKTQRNKPSIPLDLSINILKLNPSTAKPAIKKDEDMAIFQKREAFGRFLEDNLRNKEFGDISGFSNGKNKIAVIHIDGNGLGQLIPRLTMPLSEFSLELDCATKKAYEDARDDTMSIRDVILGGDDVVVICNANDALTFTKKFLENFEKETKKTIGKLTACAGIAYCNEKYPFHYAVSLAEALCSATKKHSKNIDKDLAPSSLMFHNIQSSNFQSWDKFVKDELTITNDEQTIRCDFGPYYLNQDGEPQIQDFINTVEAYRCEGSPISRLRNWLGELYKNDEYAKNLLDRINEITAQSGKWKCEIMDKNLKTLNKNLSNDSLIIHKDGFFKTPIYDILQILSVTEAK